MKTIKEWLKEYLTEEEYKKAKKYKKEIWKDKTFSFKMALVLAFEWYKTEEGDYYWYEISLRNWYKISLRNTPVGKVKQKDRIVGEVRKDLLNRSETGIKKYNTTLDRTDLSLLDWHQHHYEELLDAALYTKRIIKELKNQL